MGNEHRELLGRDVLASDGARLGHVVDVYVEPGSGAPKWLVLPGGILSSAVAFVPADGAAPDEDGRLVVGYTRKQVRKAPHPSADGELSPVEEADLARHYRAASRATTASPFDAAEDATVETDVAHLRDVDATDEWLIDGGSSDESMVRAEEDLRVDTGTRPAQRARLVKRIVTEQVTFTVPVRREVLHVEYEDVAEDELVPAGPAEPFAPVPDQEIVLYAEIVEYEKKIVAKERVRLRKEVVDEVVDLRTDLRKEEVDVVGATTEPTFI